MYVTDLEGNSYTLQATTTNYDEVNGNQTLEAIIEATKVNSEFIKNLSEMWNVVDHDEIEHKIIYAKRQGKGDKMTVEITAIPLFFDVLNNDRIYTRYDEHMTAELAFNRIFDGTGFGYILNGSFSAVEWEGFGDGETKLKTFQRALERYKAEFEIVGNTVYLEDQIGRDTSIMYRHRLNASEIVHEIDADEMWTYAKGYGDFEDGEDGGWETAKLEREYTSPLAKIIGVRHAPPIKDGRVTHKSSMDEQLKRLVDDSLKISISANIQDLREQGYDVGQSKAGDRVFVIDERIGLNEEIRVINQTLVRDWRGNVVSLDITFGSDKLSRRHKANIDTATDNISDIMNGKVQIPYNVLDDAVKNATKALQDAQTELKFTDNGILAIDKKDSNLLTLFNSAGIGVSTDGGNTFKNALTGKGINASVVTSGAMLANRIAGGVLSSLNGNTVFNLNDGELTMQNTEFSLGGGADIEFTSIGNRLYYSRNDWSAGMGVGRSINDTYPYAFLGTVKGSRPHANDDYDFSGFIANTNDREKADDVGNSVVGNRFHVRDVAVSFSKGFLFHVAAGTPYFSPMNMQTYDYNLGSPNNRWRNTYLSNNPDVSSDRRIKKDITDIDLEFAKKFLKVDSKRYRKRLSNATLSSGVIGSNPYEFGFIAQDIEPLFEGKDMRFESLVSTSKNGDKSMQYGQIPAIHHVLIQDLYKEIEDIKDKLKEGSAEDGA